MSTRLKIWLAYAALIVVYLALINYLLSFASQVPPVMPVLSALVGMLAFLYLTYGLIVPAMFGRLGPKRELPPAGPVIATGRCEGRVGWFSFSGPIRVTVHSDRLTLRAFAIGEYTIHGQEISSITESRRRWRHELAIEHTAPGNASPFVLTSRSDDLSSAIAHIDRSPVAVVSAPDEPGDQSARNFVRNVVALLYLGGLIACIGIAGIFVTELVRAERIDLFSLLFIAIPALMAYQLARKLIHRERQD